MKKCSKCKIERPLSAFGCSKRDGIVTRCKLCHNKLCAESRIKNRTELLRKKKLYYLAHKELWIKYNETTKQSRREYFKEYGIKYRKDNKQYFCAETAKRRAIKIQATPKWVNLKVVEAFYSNRPVGHVVDHIVPLKGKTVCGLHVETNLQYLTRKQNCEKSNKYEG